MRNDIRLGVLLLFLPSVLLGILSKPTKRYRYDADFLDSEIQRIRSGRALDLEPIWTVTKSTKAPSRVTDDEEATNNGLLEPDEEGSGSEEYSSSSSEEIDITCAPGKGWHTRGQRCVPLSCPGGPAERDFNTGECFYVIQPRGRYVKPFQQWNDLNHVYRSSPMSTHFVRSMVLMRKG